MLVILEREEEHLRGSAGCEGGRRKEIIHTKEERCSLRRQHRVEGTLSEVA